MAIVAGCAAGVLGYTGLWGLAVFFLTNAIVSAALFAKAGMDASYFGGRSQLVSGGIMGGFGVLPPPAAPRLFLSPQMARLRTALRLRARASAAHVLC